MFHSPCVDGAASSDRGGLSRSCAKRRTAPHLLATLPRGTLQLDPLIGEDGVWRFAFAPRPAR